MPGSAPTISITWPTRSTHNCAERDFAPNGGGIRDSKRSSCCGFGQLRGAVEELLGRPLRQQFHFVPHHLAHAGSAYYPSGFDRAAVLVIDGIGETAATTLWKGIGAKIELVETFEYPHSLGFVWEVFCSHLGFPPYDASKLMGLAAYGNPEIYRSALQEMIRVGKESYSVDPEAIG